MSEHQPAAAAGQYEVFGVTLAAAKASQLSSDNVCFTGPGTEL